MKLMRAIAALFAVLLCTPAFGGTTTYGYDALGRLVTVSESAGGETNYEYDPAGNRISKIVVGGSPQPSELIPSSFDMDAIGEYYYSSNNPATLRDGANNDNTTSIAVYIGSITMDLGSISTVAEIRVLPIVYAYQGWGAALLNGATVEYSTDNSNWTSVGAISGATETAYKSITIGASARYIRITSTGASSNQLGLGEFRAYGS